MIPRLLFLCAALAGLTLSPVAAAGAGEEVVVIYNRRVAPDSRIVALHYAERRGVPAAQVIGLNLPEGETMSRREFHEELQQPLRKELESRGLLTYRDEIVPATEDKPGEVLRQPSQSKIRYLVLCYGVPMRIARDPNLFEAGVDKIRVELRRNEAAVDSELALLPRSEYRQTLTGPAANPFYGVTNAALLHPTNGILLVARLDGPSASIARDLVDKAMLAEANGLWGRAYFDARGLTNSGYKIGDDWIRAAAQFTRRQGFETVLDERPETFAASFPLAQVAFYAGWYDGDVSGPFTRAKVEFLPGAIAYHLHSFSAATIRTTTLKWVGPLLAKGATATLGCVEEPYLEFTPDVGALFARLLYFGFTFGEAAYASQSALSWQTIVVGDPLYRPFAKPFKELHQELEARHSPWLDWSHLRVVNLNLATGLAPKELIAYLESMPLTRQSAVLAQKLGDLYILSGDLARGAEEYRRAIKLKSSPQQKVHLQLALPRLLASVGRATEAVQAYQQFFKDQSDYPDLLVVYRAASALARKANQTALAEKWEREINRLAPPQPTNAATKGP